MKNFVTGLLKNLAHPGTIAGLVVAIAVPFLIYLAPNIGHKATIQNLDLNLPLPLFFIQLIAGIVLLVLLRKDLRDWSKGILPAKSYSILAVVFAVAIAIFAGTQIEARHRVQSDESVFLSVAQNMYYNQQTGTCNQGYFENGNLDCVATSNSFKTKGLSFLYLLGMPFLGTDLHWIFSAELLMLPLAVLLMFLAVVAWTRQPLLAFFAALLTGLQPTVLFQFRSMSVEPLYIFLSSLALLTFKWAYDRNTVKHWALSALILAFFAQTRQETVFCFAPFILMALPKLLDEKGAKTPVFFVILSVFTAPVLLTISYFQGFGFQGGEFEAHGHFFEDFAKNWEVMTQPLKENGELANPFLSYFNYLFAAGGIYLIFRAIFDATKKNYFYLKVLAFVVLYHIQTYVILENVSGDFSIEINQRYSLVMLPTMAFLGALPVAHLIEATMKYSVPEKALFKGTFIAGVIVALCFAGWTAHYKESFNNNIMYNRNHLTIEEYEILSWLKEQPKAERLFIYGRPWHFVGYGISSIHYERARQLNDDDLKQLISKYNGEVYYIRGLDCWDSKTYHKKAVEHRIPTTCDIFEREMDMDGVKNILVTNNYWVQIAKFNGRKNFNPKNIIVIDEPILKKVAPEEKLNLNEMEENTDVNKIVVDSVKFNYNLKENGEAADSWDLRIVLNTKSMQFGKYEFGEGSFTLPIDTLPAGYSNIRFIITNRNSGKTIANINKTYFNAADGVINLADLKYESHSQDWGKIGFNQTIEGHKFTVNSTTYDNGLGTHAKSETVYNIEGKYTNFRTSYGLDDESICGEGIFIEVWGDSNLLAQSPAIQNGVVQTITANVKDVQKLTIKSLPVAGINCSHVDFIQPVLIP